MQRTRRFVLLVDPRYPLENDALHVIKTAPDGERAAVLRALILMGFDEIKKAQARKQGAGREAAQLERTETNE